MLGAMAINRASSQYASTTGLNLLTPTFDKDGKENPVIGRKFKARGKGAVRERLGRKPLPAAPLT